MSLARVGLIVIQAWCNHLACTPPNPTPPKARYHTDELYILRIAPLIFKIHQLALWFCALCEVLHYVATAAAAALPPVAHTLVCPPAPPPLTTPRVRLTPLFLIGVTAVVLGTYIRLDCFRTLGHLFTFDLTILPAHRLVTARFYSYVRHPAYTGSLLLVAGLAFSHLTPGSWLTECGPLSVVPGSAAVVWVVWWAWTVAVGVSRAEAEDREMRRVFKKEWEAYAASVQWWFFPGII
ncbi:hypothetical protein AX16_008441 [Volvariella volvacea WC 439]|nr:hypothetical protein AX16_008441 [Volvariella volvacea WC 439]